MIGPIDRGLQLASDVEDVVSFPEVVEHLARSGRRLRVASRDGRIEEHFWQKVIEDARRLTVPLQSRGAAPGNTVGVLGLTSFETVTEIVAVMLTGASVLVPPLGARPGRVRLTGQTFEVIRSACPTLVVTDDELLPSTRNDMWPPEATIEGRSSLWRAALAGRAARTADVPSPENAAIRQFTSGSTGAQHGVVISHRNLAANLGAIQERLELDGDDAIASWLPLYHDMGLVGMMLLAVHCSIDLTLMPPSEFVRAPGRWLDLVAEFGTMSAAPDFAYALATRSRGTGSRDLRRWRIAVNGGDSIDPRSVQRFSDAAAASGFARRSVCCCYGLAESTVAVTVPRAGTGLRIDRIDGAFLGDRGLAEPSDGEGAVEHALLGPALAGLEVEAMSPEGEVMGERVVGEIAVRGTAVARSASPNGQASQDEAGSPLMTGDLGYLVDGELVIVGRSKETVILNGRNLTPQAVERLVEQHSSIPRGGVAAFSTRRRKRDRLVVVAEAERDLGGLRAEIARILGDTLEVSVADVVVVAPGMLPRTSSGKLRRIACKQRYDADEWPRDPGGGCPLTS